MKIETPVRLRLLLLEDDPADAELVLHELRRAGIDAETVRVISREDFEARLDPCPDAILSDYQLPSWTGLQALQLVRQRGLDVPFIIVSGTIGEDVAVETMRQGADDYLLKDRLSRLGAALTQALERRRLREEARKGAGALQERDAELRQAQQLAKLAHVVSKPDGSFESWSESLPALIGMDCAGMPKSTREWLTLLHPDDRAMFRNQSIEAGKNRSRLDMEYRLQRGDGAWIQIRHLIEPYKEQANAAGRTRWFNTVQDVTEQKRAGLALQRLSVAVRQSGTAIVITDPAGAIEFVNPKFEEMTGYSAAEIIGKNPRFLKSGMTPPETYRDLWKTITAGKEWRGELQNRRKNGELYWENQHISPVFDDKGEILNFIAIKEDVTGWKRAEHEMQRLCMAMDVSVDSIYLTDPATMRFVYLNNAACQRLGYTREQLLQKGPQDVLAMDREQIGREYGDVVAAGEQGLRHERSFVRSDGGVGTTELHRRALRINGGTLIVTIGRDITERKRADERIRRLNRVYVVLSGINSTIVRVESREELFKEACRIAVEAGRFMAAWIGIVESNSDSLDLVAWQGLDEAYIRAMPVTQRAAPGSAASGKIGLAPQAILQKKPVIAADMTTDPRILLRKESQERGFRSLAILPLIVSGNAVGVLALYAAETNFFDAEEMKLLNELAGDISYALDHIEKSNKLNYLAYFDSLTGIANRSLFHERLTQYAHAAQQHQGKLALVLLDVERFKTINDSLGRPAGDELLKQLAGRLASAADPANVARIGVDHFALVLPEIKGRSEISRTVERIWRDCFAQPFRVSDTDLRIAAKAGIALFPSDGGDAEALFTSAEAALQEAQKTGEWQLFHTADLTAGVANQLALEIKLRLALEKNEFVLHYQPKVDLHTGAIAGVEALLRWQSPELGLVPPLKFIPLMEETGLILEVGAWALQRASLDHRIWVEQGLKAPRIAVNVSPIQLRQRGFISVVEQAISGGVAPTGIDLEITESLIMEDVQGNIAKLKAVRGLGVSIAIDDFGTGYSSLGYLAKLPVQSLKIDRSFIITMLLDPDTMSLVQTIISLAHSMRLKVVAEGVDSEEQAKMLRLLRCDQMQGYLFSKPVPAEQLVALLKAHSLPAVA